MMTLAASRVPMSERPLVSFVIPHKGREELLHRTVASIAALDLEGWRLEVTVVSANPVPPQVPVALPGDLHVVHLPAARSIAAQRNAGVAASRGQYLAFTDADVALERWWLREAAAALHRDPGYVLVAGAQRCPARTTWVERIRCGLAGVAEDRDIVAAGGVSLFLRREDFDRASGFPEHLTTCEDIFFTRRLASVGRLRIAHKAGFEHLGEDRDLATLFRKEIWRARSNLQSLYGRAVPVREWPSIAIPLVWPLATLGAASAAALGQPQAAAALAVVAAAPVAAYAVRAWRACGGSPSLAHALVYYLVFFTARSIGTITGLAGRG